MGSAASAPIQPNLQTYSAPVAAGLRVGTDSRPTVSVVSAPAQAVSVPVPIIPVVTSAAPNSRKNQATASDEGVRACCKFRLSDLQAATGSFSSANVVGEGGFGKVYRGTLVDGTQVAVKRLDPLSLQGDHEYYSEIAMLTKLRHPNLVCIMGMCNEDGQKLGVFEYMSQGSLRGLLDKKELSWRERIIVAVGIARGLAYLHEMTQPPVIHCDFKSANVLIDQHGQAHVADFGLARHIGGCRPAVNGTAPPTAVASDVTTVTSIRGTFGYLSPEYLEMGHASVRADVFAFGVVLLELLTVEIISAKTVQERRGTCIHRLSSSPSNRSVFKSLQAVDASRGRGSEGLADWARPRLQTEEQMRDFIDPAVTKDASAVQVAVFCEVADACLRRSPRERPSMLEVVRTLSAVLSYSEIPQQTVSEEPKPAAIAGGWAAVPASPSTASNHPRCSGDGHEVPLMPSRTKPLVHEEPVLTGSLMPSDSETSSDGSSENPDCVFAVPKPTRRAHQAVAQPGSSDPPALLAQPQNAAQLIAATSGPPGGPPTRLQIPEMRLPKLSMFGVPLSPGGG